MTKKFTKEELHTILKPTNGFATHVGKNMTHKVNKMQYNMHVDISPKQLKLKQQTGNQKNTKKKKYITSGKIQSGNLTQLMTLQ